MMDTNAPLASALQLPPAMAAAFEHNGAAVSRQQFYAIACDPRRSVAVEACAGAGKTWMLVSRMVRALLQGCAPHEILAITFTKKAAGEMRQRLQQWLLQFASASDDALRQELQLRGLLETPTAAQLATLRGLHLALLHSGRTVQIRTFHSWFAALLRSAPMAALADLGLPANYELLENDALAVALVWRRFLMRVAQDPQSRRDYEAAVATHGRHQTHKALEAALSKRVEFVLAEAHGVVDASVHTFGAQYPAFAGYATPAEALQTPDTQALLWAAARALGSSTLVTCTKAASDLEAGLSAGKPAQIVDALLTKTGTARKLSEKVVGIALVRQAQALLLDLAQAEAQFQAWLHHHRMARLARGLVVDFADLKRERGWVDMGDLERAALALMADPVLSGWVQERLDARVRHLLIDEFQDTNPLQWQALRAWLEGYTGAGVAPSVFIVGDPKQSIYRFRRAEPQVFIAAQDFVRNGLGGDVLSCDHTRRNAPAVIDVVNAVMQQAQDAGDLQGYRNHTTESTAQGQCYKLPRLLRTPTGDDDLDASAGDIDQEPTTTWRNSLTTPRREAEETRKVLECRQAARWLHQQLKLGELEPSDIMVLARKRERLGLMQAELAALHIAAQQPEKMDLMDFAEVQDIVALLDALVSPLHDLSLARALKSPIFGVADDDLVALALAVRECRAAHRNAQGQASLTTPPPSWFAVLCTTAHLPAPLQAAAQSLQRWQGWATSLPPFDALQAIYSEGDVLARFAAAAPAAMRGTVLANLNALLGLTLQLDGGRYLHTYGLVRALRAGGNAAPVRSEPQAVRLLTVHGAKGLEARLVLLLDTDGEAPRADTMGVLVQWPGESAYPERFAFMASETKPSACLKVAVEQEQAARQREEINGLYVALTRTQSTLVVSSQQPHKGADQSWWQRLEPLLQDAPWSPQTLGHATPPGATSGSRANPSMPVPESTFSMLWVPNRAAGHTALALPAIKKIVELDSDESRVGQAMHRLLEWLHPRAVTQAGPVWTALQCDAVALAFALNPAQMQAAQAAARSIVMGEAAWAWQPHALAWAGNEVALHYQGQLLRLDRLVQRADTGHWWVLDYKSAAQPQRDVALRQQLDTYRTAVVQAYPGQTVRAAFLTPQGALIELPAVQPVE